MDDSKRILVIGKFPPIQGGVSSQTLEICRELSIKGHKVTVLTNADEVPYGYRAIFDENDKNFINNLKINVLSTRPINGRGYIPFANPFLSKLIGLGNKELKSNQYDLIYAHYFEPYGLCAAIIGVIHKIKVILRHAGSDLGRLSKHSELLQAYSWMLGSCDQLISSGKRNPDIKELLSTLGVDENKIVSTQPSNMPWYFRDIEVNFDLPSHIKFLKEKSINDSDFSRYIQPFEETFQNLRKNPDSKVLLSYGKITRNKGIFELVNAFSKSKLRSDWLLMIVSVGNESVDALLKLIKKVGIADRVVLLPPLSPWKIPALIKSSEVVSFLENDFPISFHGPRIPREALALGTALLVSREIVNKQPFKANMIDQKTCFIVEDPKMIDDLADKLDSIFSISGKLTSIGKQGKSIYDYFEKYECETNGIANYLDKYITIA